LKFFRVQS